MGTAGTLGGWALQGHLVVGRLGTAGTLGGDTWWLGSTGTLGGWALQGHLVGTLGGWALKSACSRASTTSSLKSNNPTVRVGNNDFQTMGQRFQVLVWKPWVLWFLLVVLPILGLKTISKTNVL